VCRFDADKCLTETTAFCDNYALQKGIAYETKDTFRIVFDRAAGGIKWCCAGPDSNDLWQRAHSGK
jgi:hypothetical protein